MEPWRWETMALLSLALAACQGSDDMAQGGGARLITQVRLVDKPADAVQTVKALSSADRFGFDPKNFMLPARQGSPAGMAEAPGGGLMGQDKAGPPTADVAQPLQLTWITPAGWQEIAPTPTRNPNFLINRNSDMQCYVTMLGGTGGGAEANINRWRGQMGQPPLSAEAIGLFEKIDVLGQPAPVVLIEGTYRGMAANKPGPSQGGPESPTRPNDAMLATVAELGNQAVFVKMVGPAAQVKTERENFIRFCRSLRPAK